MPSAPLIPPPNPAPAVVSALFDRLRSYPALQPPVLLSEGPSTKDAADDQLMYMGSRAPQKWDAFGKLGREIELSFEMVIIVQRAGVAPWAELQDAAYGIFDAVERALWSEPGAVQIEDVAGRPTVNWSSIGDVEEQRGSVGTRRWIAVHFYVTANATPRLDLPPGWAR